MRGAPLALGLALLATALSGCLGGAPPPSEPLAPLDEDDPDPLPPSGRPPGSSLPSSPPPGSPSPTPPTTPPSPGAAPPPEPFGPLAVIAHIDTGINPYHKTFRDPGPHARQHPSTYIPGYPADAVRLDLSLDAPTYGDALQRDEALWSSLQPGKLYWVPGTRIVGAISFGPGGTLCAQPLVEADPPPSPVPPLPIPADLAGPAVDCPERVILDDHGHGTMTATRMAGGASATSAANSLCPSCRIVSIEGLGGAGVRWAADQGWIDVQTNSWSSLVPVPEPDAGLGESGQDIRAAFAHAAARMMTFAASGNGLGFAGVIGEPTYQQATGAAGVLYVGAHDNGRVTLYHGAPPHVVADGYGGPRANARDMDELADSPETCCTSASSPYAAGGAAAILLEARRLLGHAGSGFPGGVGARGAFQARDGPLVDGELTLEELRRLVLLSATARPLQGPHDGLVQCVGRSTACQVDATDLGGNPYCPGCWSFPARWSELPAQGPLYQLVGYGSVEPTSLSLALSVLRGDAAPPERPDEDALFAADQRVRGAFDGGE